jgi:transposase-like protein
LQCPECQKDAILVESKNGKDEYFCKECKSYFMVTQDEDSIEYEDIEFDNSDFDYDGDN